MYIIHIYVYNTYMYIIHIYIYMYYICNTVYIIKKYAYTIVIIMPILCLFHCAQKLC